MAIPVRCEKARLSQAPLVRTGRRYTNEKGGTPAALASARPSD